MNVREKKKLEYSWNYLLFPKERKIILVKFDLRLEEDSKCVKKKLDYKLGYVFRIIYFFQRKGRQLLKENNERVKKELG